MKRFALYIAAGLVTASLFAASSGHQAGALAPSETITACTAYTASASRVGVDYGQVISSSSSQQSTKTLKWKYDTTYKAGNFCLTSGATKKGKQAFLYFQKDGNLVLYNDAKVAQWASNTNGRGAIIRFQSDRNIVIYDAANKPIWASMNTNSVPRNGAKIATRDGEWYQNFNAAAGNIQKDWYYSTFRPAFAKNELTLTATDTSNVSAPVISIQHTSSWQSDWDAGNYPIPSQTLWYGNLVVKP